MALSPAQLAAYAAAAGFTGAALNTATAIALAESSGNPFVVGDSNLTPGGSVGLWQINLAAHPEYSAADLLNPQANANAAFQVYQDAGGQFTPWTTFKTGAYASYLPATAAISAPSSYISSTDPAALGGSILGMDPNTLIIGGVLLAGILFWWLDD
jgi:hypothetical protein